ncbi:hypothetical protein [Vibrio sp. 10N.239.312.D08]|uniref:hypothetical protein n=1 Tax=Vibrio sp. 10N.239.312.D08 TaxID=3229978 RepID=UPI0035510929
MYQPAVFTQEIQRRLRDEQTATVIEVTDIIELLTNRTISLIKRLATISGQYGLSGTNLLMTLIRELDIILEDFISNNDADIDLFVKLLVQNAVYPARTIVKEQATFEIEEALKVLSLDSSNPDHLCKYEADGTAGDEATIELRNLFGLASYREELFPESKPDVVTPDDVDMALWLAMLGITYLVMLDLVMQDSGGCH